MLCKLCQGGLYQELVTHICHMRRSCQIIHAVQVLPAAGLTCHCQEHKVNGHSAEMKPDTQSMDSHMREVSTLMQL